MRAENARRTILSSEHATGPTADQFAGCLIGQCLGDAVGAPVEGMPPGTCRRYVELELRVGTAGRGRGRYRFGQYTDDSQLARELMISIRDRGGFDPEDFASRIEALFRSGRIVGHGRATWEAASRLQNGVPWDQAGTPSPAAGNGSAMRAAPIGLLYWNDPAAMIAAAIDQGRITHGDHRCAAGSIAVAGATALALAPGSLDTIEFVERLATWVASTDAAFADHLRQLPLWLTMPPERAAMEIAQAGIEGPPENGWGGISPFVIGSVLWSLYAFLRTPSDYWETICMSIWPGGDVDTTAAMAGAISGAHVGLGGLPLLADRVQDQGEWDYSALVELATEVHARHGGGWVGRGGAEAG